MPNTRQEHLVALAVDLTAWGPTKSKRRSIMRVALLTGVAALSLLGAASAQAETIYVQEPNMLATSPGYVYTAPTFGQTGYASGYAVTPDGRAVIAEPPSSYVVVAPPREVVMSPPLVVAPRDTYAPRQVYEHRVLPRDTGIVTTGYSNTRSCFVDLNGFERCY
jgi:hypothetical protein